MTLAGEAHHLDLPLQEPQGEAVEFGRDGTIHLSSEGGKRETPAVLARLTCRLPQG